MTSNKAFLLPVVIDETREDDENVPDRFRTSTGPAFRR